ncbi:ABC transporter substrate-binding protein [Azospirillum cavernae]|nr:ABC transporter substrate-binding protein [Azospirillum cavernae]
MKRALTMSAAVVAVCASWAPMAQAASSLVIESWRADDLAIWQDKIIPAFEKTHPDIKVTFAPTAPKEYNAALNAKLESGTAGDIVTCRPFDASLEQFTKGRLAPLNDLPGMNNFSAAAKLAWSTDDGKTAFCVPMASVLHGFLYNKEAFDKLGLKEPKTEDELFAALDKIKKDGTYVPMAMGTADQWEAATTGYQNIGPNYWKGEEGRNAVIQGTQKLSEGGWLETLRTLAKWAPYLGDGYKAQSYADSQNIFTLGRAAIYPGGSWEISGFNAQATFKMGAFPPPVRKVGDTCYISDHPDIAMGVNTKSKNQDAAKKFLTWVTTPDFAKIYANALPGFFSLQTAPVAVDDPLAQTFVGWRNGCKSTIRSTYQILSRGAKPNLEDATWGASANVINGSETPEKAAERLQAALANWYKPQQK